MKRGQYGKPFRPPPDGWSVPPKIFFGGLYQHLRPALDNLPKFVNSTQVVVQDNQLGPPYMRYDSQLLASNCYDQFPNNLPRDAWIGLGSGQGLPFVLGGTLNNTFQQNGTNSFGNNARQRGFKNVQAVRQWHGTPPWTSHDTGQCPDTFCATLVGDPTGKGPTDPGYIPTWTWSGYESYQPAASQVHYLCCTLQATAHTFSVLGTDTLTQDCTSQGAVTVDAYSGLMTSTITAQETDTLNPISGGPATITHPTNTLLTGVGAQDVHCAGVNQSPLGAPDIQSTVAGFNSFFGALYQQQITTSSSLAGFSNTLNQLPPITDPNNYSGRGMLYVQITDYYLDPATGDSVPFTEWQKWELVISWSRTDTVYTWSFDYTNTGNNTTNPTGNILLGQNSCSGTLTLSQPLTAVEIYDDIKALLATWNLADDAQYPPRTDGLWQIAPLISRDEAEGNVSPCAGFLGTVDDYRSPVDSNGNPVSVWTGFWAKMPGYDPNAYGFVFPPGTDQNSAVAIGFKQYALTGLICGMPMPAAFTDNRSYWYNPNQSAGPDAASFENFFDFRAKVWSGCEHFPVGGGPPVQNIFVLGHGQWCYDMISATGAQLPHCSTQWTNFNSAAAKPPYAYLIQGDQQRYVDPAGNDLPANRGDGLWAQKCCEVLEIWPSQDFFRPAGADRFAPDETAVYCLNRWEGDTVYFLSDPANINTGDIIGVNNNGYSGLFTCDVNHGSDSITLIRQICPLPTGFELPSKDSGACVWKIRFTNASNPLGLMPAILGRDAVSQIVNNHDGTVTIVLANAEPNLMPGDATDICAAHIDRDANGNKTNETMTVLATAVVLAPRIDDTHFMIIANAATLAGATHIQSAIGNRQSPIPWYWDDNGRKGDFTVLNWLFDYRTNGQRNDMSGETDCAGNNPPTGEPKPNYGFQTAPPLPAVCTPNNSLVWTGGNFQAQGACEFRPCCYSVVAITPNGETWNNGIVIPFPQQFLFDGRYGARWQCEIKQAMTDLLWQAPHKPCGFLNQWVQDDGTCHTNPEDDSIRYYAFPPVVEARINLPNINGENAPALPAGITIGYINPVNAGGLTPPGYQTWNYDFTPNGFFTFWDYRLNIENSGCPGPCGFNYVDMENLPCVVSYSPPAQPAAGLAGLPGIS